MGDGLVVEGLNKRFGGVQATTDVSMVVPDGSIRCIVGPNGAGKSTFLSLLSGHTKPDAGRIHFRGRDITNLPVHRIAKMGLVRKFQRPSFYPELTVAENLAIPAFAAGQTLRSISSAIGEVAERVALDDVLETPAVHLPHGRAQWLELGMLLAREAKTMLLDEPTAGMTPAETRNTAALIASLVRETGISAIVIEHDTGFVRSLEAPVTVLHVGRVIAEGSMSEIENDPQVRAVYLGEGNT